MNYFNILHFKKEPFSNSPEPEFLFQLPQYSDCLQKLELAVRLRRGLNVVIGDVGTGKTTLCRKLIQNFSETSADSNDTEIETRLLLDPSFGNTAEFLQTVASMLGIKDLSDHPQSEWHLKEKIKNYLFDRGVNEHKIVVLIIDEGQKIPESCLEILREFLNYETNEFKLLQIIIFAQNEFHTIIKRKANVFDRINLLYFLRPLSFRQMKAMINYRLSVARNFESAPSIFTFWGFVAVYLATGGYPRKIVFLCHQVVLKMIIRGKMKAGWFLVRSCLADEEIPLRRTFRWVLTGMILILFAGLTVSAITQQGIGSFIREKLKVLSINPVLSAVADRQIMKGTSLKEFQEAQNSQNVGMPDSMGRLSMNKRRTMWWTLYNIYGDNGPQMMQNVFHANPHLQDKSMIAAGTIVTLPAIPASKNPFNPGDIIILLESGQDLEKMYNIFRNHPWESKLPGLAFLACWNTVNGFEFNVVIDKKFKDIHKAQEAAAKLPPEIGTKAKIISQWNADTVFFNRRPLQY